ncbi:MAG TPA: site-specific integrase [Bacteroidetes bacterium]|nr:site-specific integrase [Bacteroidota bacterium]
MQRESMEEFVDRYIEFSRSTKSPKTAQMDEYYLRSFTDFMGDIELSSIRRADVESYIRHRRESLAPTSVNIEIRHLKAAFNRAVEWELIDTNPWSRVQQIRVPEKDVPRFLEEDDIQKLREAFRGDPLRDLVEFYLLTGARLREATSLMGEDVDFRRGLIHFRGGRTKTKRNRTIPFGMVQGLRELLEAQKPKRGKPVFRSNRDPEKGWDADWVKHHISRVMTRIGLPWATTHTLRHTFASHMVMAGVELWTVAQLLGHSSVTVTERYYAHLAPGHAERAMAKLPYARNRARDGDPDGSGSGSV